MHFPGSWANCAISWTPPNDLSKALWLDGVTLYDLLPTHLQALLVVSLRRLPLRGSPQWVA